MTFGKLINNKNQGIFLPGDLKRIQKDGKFVFRIDYATMDNVFHGNDWTFQADLPVEAGWYESEKYPLKSGGSPYEVFHGEVYLAGDRDFPLNTKQIIQLGKLTRLGVGL